MTIILRLVLENQEEQGTCNDYLLFVVVGTWYFVVFVIYFSDSTLQYQQQREGKSTRPRSKSTAAAVCPSLSTDNGNSVG